MKTQLENLQADFETLKAQVRLFESKLNSLANPEPEPFKEKVIKEEDIMIGGHKVEIQDGKAWINGEFLTKDFLIFIEKNFNGVNIKKILDIL